MSKVIGLLLLILLSFILFPYGLLASTGLLYLFIYKNNISNTWYVIYQIVCFSGLFLGFPYSILIGLLIFLVKHYLENKDVTIKKQKEIKYFQEDKNKVGGPSADEDGEHNRNRIKDSNRYLFSINNLNNLETDYLKAFIERIGLKHFSAFDTKKYEEYMEIFDINDLDTFLSFFKEHHSMIKKNISQNYEGISEEINILESLFLILEELPKLQVVLASKGVALKNSEIIEMLKAKCSDMNRQIIKPSMDDLYENFKSNTFFLLAKAKKDKTNENIAHAFATYIQIIKRANTLGNVEHQILDSTPFLSDLLSKLLIESKINKKELSIETVNDLLTNKLRETEISFFENELKYGVKTTRPLPLNYDELSGVDFESFLQDVFQMLGYSVTKTPLSGDQGADLIIEKGNEKTVVQAKRYTGAVSNKAVQEVIAAIKYYKCNHAIVVTNSSYTRGALQLSVPNEIELWDGNKLRDVVNTINKNSSSAEFAFTTEEGINKLLPDIYKNSNLPTKEIAVKNEGNSSTKIVKTKCLFCTEEMDITLNLKEIGPNGNLSFKATCPNCHNTSTATVEVKIWVCKYCSEQFNTIKEAKEHEQSCVEKNN